MIALRLWCLLALLSVARCELGSGDGLNEDDLNTGIDDEDASDFELSGMEMSGAGTPQQNSTVDVSTTVVVTQTTTTTPRTTTKAVIITKSQRTTPLMQQLTTTTTPLAAEDEEDDEVDETDLDTEIENPVVNNEPVQTTAAGIVEGEDIAPEWTTSAGLDLFQYVWNQPGIVAGLIGGAVLGVLFAILLTLFVIYRFRRRNDRKYRKGGSRGSQDETGAFWFDEEDGAAIAYSRASAERYPSHGPAQQAGAYVNPQAGTLKAGTSTLRGSQMLTLPPGMGPQAQPLLYNAPMAPNPQNAYDEYLANLYNQQLYGGYMQQKA